MDTRIKGQEVVLRITRQGRVESQLTAIKDFTLTLDLAVITAGYLGETSDRFDDIVNGCSGSFGVDAEGPEVLRFIDFLAQRAQRKIVGDTVVNVTATFNFPDGRRPRLMIRDLKFEPVPIGAPGRPDYVNTTFSFKAPPPKLIEG